MVVVETIWEPMLPPAVPVLTMVDKLDANLYIANVNCEFSLIRRNGLLILNPLVVSARANCRSMTAEVLQKKNTFPKLHNNLQGELFATNAVVGTCF